MRKVLQLALLLAVVPLVARAEIYKWVDEKGRIQYGENPPAGVKAAPIRPEAMPGGKPRPPEDLLQQDAEFRRRQIEQQRADEAAARQAELRKRNCASARDRLSSYEGRRRPYKVQNGERVFMTDDEREAETARLRAQVSQWCG